MRADLLLVGLVLLAVVVCRRAWLSGKRAAQTVQSAAERSEAQSPAADARALVLARVREMDTSDLVIALLGIAKATRTAEATEELANQQRANPTPPEPT